MKSREVGSPWFYVSITKNDEIKFTPVIYKLTIFRFKSGLLKDVPLITDKNSENTNVISEYFVNGLIGMAFRRHVLKLLKTKASC